jgi:hypothetical protein
MSNEGGRVSCFEDEVVAENDGDAIDLVSNRYYFMSIESCTYIRAATDEEIRIGEVYGSA